MRLDQLTLDFFGHFTNKQLDFGSPDTSESDFHVIYGPNEAGKTTIMEAYLRLLYGFPAEEPYRFQHQRKNLRVSGILKIEGQSRSFTRVPRRGNSLLDEHGAVLGDGSLQAHLGGLSLDDYRNLLCIDDETIEKGGKEIVSSKGDIGTLLFSAAAGIGDLTEVLATVAQSADELYRKRASKTRLALLKKEYADVEKQIRDLDVPASSYRKIRQAYDVARNTEQDVKKQRMDLFEQQARLEAQIDALPILMHIDELDRNLSGFDAYPQQLDINPEQLVTLLTRQSKASSDADRLKKEIQESDEALKCLVFEPKHLVLDESLKALDKLKSLALAAEHDLDKQRRNCVKALDDMKRIALDLGDAIDPLELIVSPVVLQEFEQAREGLSELSLLVKSEQTEVDTLNEIIKNHSLNCVGLEKTLPADTGLINTLERFSADKLLTDYREAHQLVERARHEYQTDLDALASKGQRFESIPHCPLNAQEVEERIDDLQVITLELETAIKDSDGYKIEIAALESRIEKLSRIDGLISDEQAGTMKEERNATWLSHKNALTITSAESFEACMIKFDAAMEARLVHANDLGGLRQIEQSLADTVAKADAITSRISDLTQKRIKQEQFITDAVAQSGLDTALSPKSYLAWVRKCESAVSRESVLLQLSSRYSPIFEKAHRLSEELSSCMELDSPDFNQVMAEARSIESSQRTHMEKLRIAKERLSELEGDMKTRSDKLEKLNADYAAARADWQKRVEDTFSGQVGVDRLRASMEPLRELRELDKERLVAVRQVADMEHDQTQFAQEITALAARVDVEPEGSAHDTYDKLKQMSDAARKARQSSEALMKKQAQHTEELATAGQVLSEIDIKVGELGQLFPESVPSSTVAELRTAVDGARLAIDYRSQKAVLEVQLLGKLGVDSIPDARAILDDLSDSTQQAELKEVQASLKIAEEQYKTTIEQRVACKKELDSVTGDAEIALLDQRKTTLALEMSEVALEYLKLSTGLRLAEEAIRRYRDTHRSAMMLATEKAFAELTNGAYLTLKTQTDGAAETLIAIDKSGAAKQARDMSKGTRFQLYLALRAAAYEQLCAQGKCLPFVCDDIFETFDEQRTRSACQMLDRIGRTGQAIYLTHHQHVVDIAKEVCGGAVQIHAID